MDQPRRESGDRSISPVVGVALLVVIVVVLAASASAMFMELTDDPAAAPVTNFEFEYESATDAVTVRLTAGETISRSNTDELLVVIDSGSETERVVWATDGGGVADLGASDLTVDDTITIDDASGAAPGDRTLSFELEAGDTVSVIWVAPDSDQTAPLEENTVPSLAGGSSLSGVLDQAGSIVTGPASAVAGDGGETLDLNVGGAQALGSTGDTDGDGLVELPYVDGSGDLRMNDSDGEDQQLVDRGAVASTAKPDTDKTLLATGSWQGSSTAVFYTDADHEAIYRVGPGGTPTLVQDVSANGANSVLGIGDIDGDGDDELVYADGSQEIRYLEAGGTVKSTGFTSGSSTGIGNGPLADIDGDGTAEAIVVDGSNDVRLVDSSGATATPAQSSVDAAKSPATATDVDGDGDREIVFVDASSTDLQYIDDVTGSPTVTTLQDADGNVISGDKSTGVVS